MTHELSEPISINRRMKMRQDTDNQQESCYVTGSERRHAASPRRSRDNRRHRVRFESLISDCRTGLTRRREDEEGFVEIKSLYNE